MNRKITENQLQYIRILSLYESTWDQDLDDIISFIVSLGKKSIKELTVDEASRLIEKLLQRPVEYTFLCGEKAMISKREYNSISVLGIMEGCMHFCPKNIDIHQCKHFKNYYYSDGSEGNVLNEDYP